MRKMIVAGGQLGPITRDESKKSAVARMVALMKEAEGAGSINCISRTCVDYLFPALVGK